MTKHEYKVWRIYQESSPRENKVTQKMSVLQYVASLPIINTPQFTTYPQLFCKNW